MIALYPPPSSGPLDPLAAIEAEDRPAPAGRPYVLSNMIESADGATALDGVSGGLGGPADQAVFGALRAIADMILVGSATVDAEDYRPPGPGSDAVQAGRRQRGQAARPTVVVVTASASLAPDRRLFSDPDNRPIVATVSAAPRERVAALAAVADVIECGEDSVDLTTLAGELHRRGARTVLSEGGPTLNAQLITDDLLDEWNLTIAPLLVAGDAKRPAHGRHPPTLERAMTLTRVWQADDLLFCRWLRQR